MPTFLDLTADRIQLKVNGEPIGFAYGAENWFRASGFVKQRGEVWPLPHQRHWGSEPIVMREQTLRFLAGDHSRTLPEREPHPTWRDLAKGCSGLGEDE